MPLVICQKSPEATKGQRLFLHKSQMEFFMPMVTTYCHKLPHPREEYQTVEIKFSKKNGKGGICLTPWRAELLVVI